MYYTSGYHRHNVHIKRCLAIFQLTFWTISEQTIFKWIASSRWSVCLAMPFRRLKFWYFFVWSYFKSILHRTSIDSCEWRWNTSWTNRIKFPANPSNSGTCRESKVDNSKTSAAGRTYIRPFRTFFVKVNG